MSRDLIWQVRCALVCTGVGILVGFYLLTRAASSESVLTKSAPGLAKERLWAWVIHLGGGALAGALVGVVVAVGVAAVLKRRRR